MKSMTALNTVSGSKQTNFGATLLLSKIKKNLTQKTEKNVTVSKKMRKFTEKMPKSLTPATNVRLKNQQNLQ